MKIDLSVQQITKRFGDFTAVDAVSFDVEDGKFFSILGPSGCGKTTLLRMIAGFYQPSSGRIEIGGKDMDNVPPNERSVNLIFQNLALFPMMDVKENVAFGLKRRGEKGRDAYRKVEDMLERVGLPGFGNRKVQHLSGGQKQRVAIARCLVLDPTVLLLDEPLGALDLKLREHMKVELKKLQADVGTTFVYITHDQSEAMVMSDKVAVMSNGQFEQVATPQDLYTNPKTSFVAQFVGENNRMLGICRSVATGSATIQLAENLSVTSSIKNSLGVGDKAELFIRPESILVNPAESIAGMNRIRARVKAILFEGCNSRYLVSIIGTDMEMFVGIPKDAYMRNINVNEEITIGWHAEQAICFKDLGKGGVYEDIEESQE